jgi:hypothetical protein
MDGSPSLTQMPKMDDQDCLDLSQRLSRETVVLAQLRRPIRALQIEYRLAVGLDHVDMSWSVVVWVDDGAQPASAQNRTRSIK